MEEAREKGKELQEARNNLLSMPMMGMEMTDDLPGLCVSHPFFVPAFSRCRIVTIVKSVIDREASLCCGVSSFCRVGHLICGFEFGLASRLTIDRESKIVILEYDVVRRSAREGLVSSCGLPPP